MTERVAKLVEMMKRDWMAAWDVASEYTLEEIRQAEAAVRGAAPVEVDLGFLTSYSL